MSKFKRVSLLALLLAAGAFGANAAQAGEGCYYSQWTYYPKRSYNYCYCYYQPAPAPTPQPEYQYHYCICYPTKPKYCYYYNPHRRAYWGRYDLEAKGYSLLEEKDRKEKLEDIPESAFPKPAAMPAIPGGKPGLVLVPPPAPPKEAPPE